MTVAHLRYRLAAGLAGLIAIYASVFARQTHNRFDLPTWIDVTEWPATLLYLAAAVAAWRRLPRRAALCIVVAMLAFFAAQVDWMFRVPLGFVLVAVASLGFIFLLPPSWDDR